MVLHLPFFIPTYVNSDPFRCQWNVHFHPIRLVAFEIVDSGSQFRFMFLPWCSSNGVTFTPVCMVNSIILTDRLTLSVQLILSSKVVPKKFFRLYFACSTTPSCFVSSVSYIQFRSLSFCKYFSLLWYKCTTLVWLCFLQDRVTKLSKNLITSLVQVDLHTRSTCHLLYLSFHIRIYGKLVFFLLCTLHRKVDLIFFFQASSILIR